MPFIRRYRLRKPLYRRRRAAATARPRFGLRTPWRSRVMYNPQPTFTETIVASPLTFNATSPGNSSYLMGVTLAQLPQVAQYQNLYNNYCIRKVQMIFVPAYNVADYNAPAAATPSAAPRMVYSIQDSSVVTTPTNEVDVLKDNGARIKMFTRPVRVTFRPTASLADALVTGGFVGVTRKNQWLTTSNPSVLHTGLAVAFTQDVPVSGNPVLAQVYVKITFSLKDPK